MKKLGRYEILEEIGRGGFAVVYKARDTELDRIVALKVLRPRLAENNAFVRRFRQEARTAAALYHPHIITIYEVGEESGQHYLAMPFLPGQTLDERLAAAEGPLPLEQTVSILEQVASALDAIHQRGLVHRDVKPTNIMVDDAGQATLLDFGIVRAAGGTQLTTTGAVMGTPQYMSPEQAEGEEIDHRSDVYSLGVVAYQMCTGQTPFDAVPPLVVLHLHADKSPPSPRELNPDLPAEVEQVLLKALAKKRGERYQSAGELIGDLRCEIGKDYFNEHRWEAIAQDRCMAMLKSHQENAISRRKHRRCLVAVSIVALFLLLIGWWAAWPIFFQSREATLLGTITAQVVDVQETIDTRDATSTAAVYVMSEQMQATETALAAIVDAQAQSTPIFTPALTSTLASPVRFGTPVPQPTRTISLETTDLVTRLAWWGEGIKNEVAYSPDGALLAVASSPGICLYNAHTLRQSRCIAAESHVESVVFSPDGTKLALGLDDNNVQLWRVSDAVLLYTLQGHTAPVMSVAFSPDGARLASGSQDNTVRLWRTSDGAPLRTLKGHTATVESVAFSQDGEKLASGSLDWTMRLWRVSDGTLLHSMGGAEEQESKRGHTGPVTSVAFSPDGRMLASGSQDKTVQLWRVSDGAPLDTLGKHSAWVTSVAFSPDDNTLASGLEDGKISLWDVSEHTMLDLLEKHLAAVKGVAFSSDGETLASCSDDKTVRLWRVSGGEQWGILGEDMRDVTGMGLSPDGTLLVSWSEGATVRLWRVSDGALLHELDKHTGDAGCATFAPNGDTLALGLDDGSVQRYRVSDGALLPPLEAHTELVSAVAFSLDGKTLASGSNDDTVRLWQISDGKLLHTLGGEEGHTSNVRSVAFSPDSETLASAADDATIRMWRVSGGELLHVLAEQEEQGGHTGSVTSVAFSPDGRMLASGSHDLTVRIWQADGGIPLYTLEKHPGWVASLTFSPDGNLLATGSQDHTVQLWRVDQCSPVLSQGDGLQGQAEESLPEECGSLLRVLDGHTGPVVGVTFSKDGTMLASSSEDGMVWLWGVAP